MGGAAVHAWCDAGICHHLSCFLQLVPDCMFFCNSDPVHPFFNLYHSVLYQCKMYPCCCCIKSIQPECTESEKLNLHKKLHCVYNSQALTWNKYTEWWHLTENLWLVKTDTRIQKKSSIEHFPRNDQ